MSQAPTPYTPNTDFSTIAATPVTTTGLPGTELDTEFAEIAASLAATQARLSEIQRDDGAMRNGVVGFVSMSADVLAAFTTIGSNYRGAWASGQDYRTGDLVISGIDNYPYLCGDPHTSSSSFESDFASGVWAILGYRPTTDSLVVNTFSGTGAQTSFNLTKNPVDENNTQVYVAGVYQKKSTYSIAGTSPAVLTFAVAPAAGTDNIEVVIGVSAELINNVVTIPNNSVGTAAIIDLNVTTAKLAASAVTPAKLATDAVETGKIKDLNVTTGKLAALAVTGEKIAGGAVDSTKLAVSAVQTANIQNGAVENNKLGTGAVDAVKLAADAVETAKIKNGAVTADKLAAGAAASNLANGDITATQIATAAVETAKIKDANITAAKLSGAQTGNAPIFGVRAWGKFAGQETNGACVVNASGNVTGVSRISDGIYEVTMATALADANYAVTSSSGATHVSYSTFTETTTQFRLEFKNSSNVLTNPTEISFMVIR